VPRLRKLIGRGGEKKKKKGGGGGEGKTQEKEKTDKGVNAEKKRPVGDAEHDDTTPKYF